MTSDGGSFGFGPTVAYRLVVNVAPTRGWPADGRSWLVASFTIEAALGSHPVLWANHLGFTKLPLSKTISVKDLLDRAAHQEAVARIRFCIAESLLGVIAGEVGIDKTVAVRAAISQLEHAARHVVYVANPTVGTRGPYVTIVRALGAVPRGFRAELVAQTQSLLAAEEHERRRRVVLVIDEAHLLSPDQLEAIRLLTNADMDSATSGSLLLVGQPNLGRQLRMRMFAALDQRIATRYQITPMDLGESAEYVRQHLALVGRADPSAFLLTAPSTAAQKPAWVCRACSTTPTRRH